MKAELHDIYSIKDLKVGFGRLFDMPNDASALRAWKMVAASPDSEYSKNPADYELWHMGVFNSGNGKYEENIYLVAEDM